VGKLGARANAHFSEDVDEVRLDRLRAQEEARRDFTVGEAFAHEPCDVELLRSELVNR
jgi:hypothetical protein